MADPFGWTWAALLADYQRGKLRKPQLVKALRDGIQPPVEALDMIADVIAGEGKPLDNTRKARPNVDKWTAANMARDLERYIDAGPDNFADEIDPANMDWLRQLHKRTQLKRRREKTTANKLAMQITSDIYGIKPRTLSDWKKRFK